MVNQDLTHRDFGGTEKMLPVIERLRPFSAKQFVFRVFAARIRFPKQSRDLMLGLAGHLRPPV
jgi:hypothetical protein